MKFVTVNILGTVDRDTGREIIVGAAHRSQYSFVAIEHITLINVKDKKVYLTLTTGKVLICTLGVLALLKDHID
ncbi:hypothetical protein PE074_00465 [Wohlfahrtiimonas chitiniclastica]|uniref:Uncharacterized protein n=2 Tax=Wohlfahrtiimonas chitiniclastica TaxID=400946 RepID=L8XW31_9GAMM|nr:MULTISPECIES: hypothetical protein [Wohlfahrtiimonas]ELV08112.1 Hypothetical protein F387_00351 [Wohlfahrtiimonas chitiniclastica SH04]KZX37605.1 hypothetical protein A6V30_01590 [Wohlfahrtiimonas chitiniclastica]MBS7815528.1 hypothetical protein [Wohlfahrtiimonas chitiniclastica]MBS7817582.1 hypothetical protein [Wohlfahrtiimonas chitiniclastica]MBS7819352.1 hypothetical protein [Wohlfahrtiimonas chitiniclastica]